jgi:hypothetical protein
MATILSRCASSGPYVQESREGTSRSSNCVPRIQLVTARRKEIFLATRRQVFAKLQPLVSPDCPFANLTETHKERWGLG